MPYTLIKGSFHIFYPDNPLSGPEPDGDTIKFQPDDKHLVELLPHTSATAKFNLKGITSIRFEGIDALETHFEVEGDTFHQQYDLAIQARDTLLAKAGFGKITYFKDKPYKVQSVEHHPIRGYILSNGLDTYGRVIAFAFTGDTQIVDGSSLFASPDMIDESLNTYMLKQGQAYGEFYITLPAELRTHLEEHVTNARSEGKGLWSKDTANVEQSAHIANLDELQELVLWPKLFRRLVAYFQAGYTGLSKFDEWLRVDPVNRDDRLILPTIELGNMHDLMHIDGDNLSMNYLPESIVIVPDDYVLPAPVPVPVPAPAPAEKGVIRIVAALINAAEKEEVGFETVTILNTTDAAIDLKGWFVADTTGKQPLSGSIDKGDTLRIHLTGQVRLSNTRDTITILDGDQKIIDQVTYEKKQLPAEGITMKF
jgi:endonuclease YncB( thermonuclease family)